MYVNIPERTTADLSSSTDVNQLQENLNLLKGGLAADAPAATLTDLYNLLVKKDIDALTVVNNATNYNTQLDIAFTGLRVEEKYLTSVTQTIDITTALDTGIEAISTWYYIWCFVADDNSYTFRFSASSTAPSVPDGYIKKRLISAVYNDASGNFRQFSQVNKTSSYQAIYAFINGSAMPTTNTTEYDLITYVPACSYKFSFCLVQQAGTSSYAAYSLYTYNNNKLCPVIGVSGSNYSYVHGASDVIELVSNNRKIRLYGDVTYHAGAAWASINNFELDI